jgi:hypothetical protein
LFADLRAYPALHVLVFALAVIAKAHVGELLFRAVVQAVTFRNYLSG